MYKIVICGPMASGKTTLTNALTQTEHPNDLLDMGVEVIDMPYPTKDNYLTICKAIFDADLIICCINFNHFPSQDSKDLIREIFSQVRKSDCTTLFAVTHCEMDDWDIKIERWKEIRAQISSELQALYPHFDDSQLFLLDMSQHSTKMGSPNAEIIDDNRILSLKVAIYRQIAKTYYKRNEKH